MAKKKAATVAGTSFSAQDGGRIPPTVGGTRDRFNTVTEPGEIVVPKKLAPTFSDLFGDFENKAAALEGGAKTIINNFNVEGDLVTDDERTEDFIERINEAQEDDNSIKFQTTTEAG